MEHQEVREHLNDYADDVLNDRNRRAVDEHLETCPACREELAALRNLQDAAAGLPRSLEPERDLWPDVRSRLEPAAAARTDRPGWMRLVTRWEPLAAAAALAVVVAGVLLLTHDRTPRETATLPAGESGVPGDFAVLDSRGERQSATVARMIWALEEESLGAGKVLVATLRARPQALSNEGLQAIDAGLRALDQAIDESAAALRADPENPQLMRRLTGYYRKRLSIMRRATELAMHA